MRKKITSIVASVALGLALVPAAAFAPGIPQAHADTAGAFTVIGGKNGTDYSYDDQTRVLTIKTSQSLTIKNTDSNRSTNNRIYVENGVSANITLAGVDIYSSDVDGGYGAAFKIADNSTGNVTITLADGTMNKLVSGKGTTKTGFAGLEKVGAGSGVGTLVIQGSTQGSGSLRAFGYEEAAGIGGGDGEATANITISGGNIEAEGGRYGAGIGGGYQAIAKNITISGGTVKASGSDGAAGIGGGGKGWSATGITISGGTVTARALDYTTFQWTGTGIGGGKNSSDIRIYGGSVNASSVSAQTMASDGTTRTHKLEISNPDSKTVTIDGTTWVPSNHRAADSSDTTLYAYLTEGEHTIAIDNKQRTYTYENGQFVLKGTVSLTNPVTMRINSSTGNWEVSYDDGDTWNDLGVSATGTAPQLQVSGDGYWQASYDDGSTWVDVEDADGNKVKATGDTGATGAQGEKGVSVSKIAKTGSEGLVDTYTITFSDGSTTTFTVTNGAKGDTGAAGKDGADGKDGTDGKDGADGKDGKDGSDGADGSDGTTPQLRVSDGYWQVSYDSGSTWADVTDSDGNKVKATGDTGTTGAQGEKGNKGDKGDTGSTGAAGRDGSDGITPRLKIGDDGFWYVSYNYGITWTSLGMKATGAAGAQGEKGDKGDTGATGADGKDGSDGVTPQLKIDDDNHWCVSYDSGSTWTDLGVNATGATGDKGDTGATGAQGEKGDTGATGAAGKDGADGVTPQLRVDEGGFLCVSYDEGTTWTSLGARVTDADAVETAQIRSSNVKSLKATAKTGGKVKLSWKAPKGVSGLKYQVRYKLKGAKKWTTATGKSKKLSMTVGKLKAGTSYRFQVRGSKKVSGKTVCTDWETTGWVLARK